MQINKEVRLLNRLYLEKAKMNKAEIIKIFHAQGTHKQVKENNMSNIVL